MGDGDCYPRAMAEKEKRDKGGVFVGASLWLRDEYRFFHLTNLDHAPRPGEELEIEGELWRVAEWTNRIECERVVN